jgi:hypothetical protein
LKGDSYCIIDPPPPCLYAGYLPPQDLEALATGAQASAKQREDYGRPKEAATSPPYKAAAGATSFGRRRRWTPRRAAAAEPLL